MEPRERPEAASSPPPDRFHEFEERGFLGPVRVFEPQRAEAVARLLEAEPAVAEWSKGHAAASRAFHSIGTLPAILDVVEALIGPDVVLRGASLVHRDPGQAHAWHVDIETSADEPGTVSVWIGLRNTDRRSSLQVLTLSHRWGITPQERAHREGKSRKEVARDDAVGWARGIDPESELLELDMGDGEAVFFDGRLWHGTDNARPEGVRTALLLQYAAADRAIRIPDFSKLDWPFRFEEGRLPPCVAMRGEAREDVNRIVPPPPSKGWVESLRLPLETDERGMGRRYLHAGPTSCVEHLGCHASALAPRRTPHEPHGHEEEEILVVLDGEAELVLPDGDGTFRVEATGTGAVAYYPSGRPHTIRNASERPVHYLMFKWRNGKPRVASGRALSTLVLRPDGEHPAPEPGGWTGRRLFEGRTRHLTWLHAHRTTMAPGAGYEPHVDPYDVAIVLLRGTVETAGRVLCPHDVAYHAAGEPHGMRNPGSEDAVYLVFEFHAEMRRARAWRARRFVREAVLPRVPRPVKSLAKKVLAMLRLRPGRS